MKVLTNDDRIAVARSVSQGWSDSEIKSMMARTVNKHISDDMLKKIRKSIEINPGYPFKHWKNMTDSEKRDVAHSIISNTITKRQALAAYRVGHTPSGCFDPIDTYILQLSSQDDKRTSEQTTLYSGEPKGKLNALDTAIEAVEAGNYPFTIANSKDGTMIRYSGEDAYGNSVNVEVVTKENVRIKVERIIK